MKTIDLCELAWCAGIFDGEGSTSSGSYGPSNSMTLRFTMGQMDRFVLDRFNMVTGKYGNVCRKSTGMYSLQINRFEHVQYVMILIWKKLSPIKREQYKKVIKFYLDNCWKPKFTRDAISRRNYEKYGSKAMQNRRWLYEIQKNADLNTKIINPFEKKNANINI